MDKQEKPVSVVHTTTKEHPHIKRVWLAIAVVTLVLVAAATYGYTRFVALNQRLAYLSKDLSSTTAALRDTTKDLSELRSQTMGISETLTNTKEDVAMANNNISAVQGQVGGVQETIGAMSGTVSTLQKLSTTDPELLKKYSKVYFLNENYAPAHLNAIPQEYVYSNTEPEVFLSEALPHLLKLLLQAKADGVTLYVDSGYRSFAKQQLLKSQYAIIYGEGTANTFSADQGYSEHQLGTAVDFITSGLGGDLTAAFADTPTYQWLTKNAHKYGFELSYPAANAHYVYEPWHWRFVGVKLATYLHERNVRFYDMDQRDIDTYLANLFDS